MSRRRSLSDDDEALWAGFVRSVTPLRSAKSRTSSKPKLAPIAVERAMARPRSASPKEPAKPPPLAPLDRRLRQRVTRGRDAIEARIDLHGMTQNQAHEALQLFLHRAQAEHKKLVLVVTGKGLRDGATTSERGVLRRQVPLWLALPEFRSLVVGFDEAHGSHGGQGALYVRLRRPR